MEQKLKVGQSCEVVEVLKDESYNSYKVGGHTIATSTGDIWLDGLNVLENGQTYGYDNYYYFCKEEVKPVGRLTVTKLK